MKKLAILLLALFTFTACGAEDAAKTAYVTISCEAAVERYGELPEQKQSLMPKDGIFLQSEKVILAGKGTALDALRDACDRKEILFELDGSAALGTEYIIGIGQLYQFDIGAESGWLYSVNGESPNVGAGGYEVQEGDEIVFYYITEYNF